MLDYETVPLHWVNRLGFIVRKELAQQFRRQGHDVSPEEWAILLILWRKGDQTPGALAEVTIRDRTTITRLIDSMVKKGLVARREDPKDRRRSLVSLTSYAAELEQELVPIARALIEQASRGIDPAHLQTTVQTLRQMTENLNAAPTQRTSQPERERQNG